MKRLLTTPLQQAILGALCLGLMSNAGADEPINHEAKPNLALPQQTDNATPAQLVLGALAADLPTDNLAVDNPESLDVQENLTQ